MIENNLVCLCDLFRSHNGTTLLSRIFCMNTWDLQLMKKILQFNSIYQVPKDVCGVRNCKIFQWEENTSLKLKNFVGHIYWRVFELTLNSSRWATLRSMDWQLFHFWVKEFKIYKTNFWMLAQICGNHYKKSCIKLS